MYMYLDWTAREAKLRDAIICLLTFIGHMVHDPLLRPKAKALVCLCFISQKRLIILFRKTHLFPWILPAEVFLSTAISTILPSRKSAWSAST